MLAAKKDGASSGKLLALLKQKQSNAVIETTWQLGTRPRETDKPNLYLPEIQTVRPKRADSQILSSAETDTERDLNFEDLPPELQDLLRVQLRKGRDVSAL